MPTTFTTAKQFADHISMKLGRSKVISLNKEIGCARIAKLVWYFGLFVGHDESINVIQENTMYGIQRFLVTGRASVFSLKAVEAMNVRQLSELVFELSEKTHDIEEHCRILNKKYAQ